MPDELVNWTNLHSVFVGWGGAAVVREGVEKPTKSLVVVVKFQYKVTAGYSLTILEVSIAFDFCLLIAMFLEIDLIRMLKVIFAFKRQDSSSL